MAKFRRAHGGDDRSKNRSNTTVRSIVLIVVFGLFLTGLFFLYNNRNKSNSSDTGNNYFSIEKGIDYIAPKDRFFLPDTSMGEIVYHQYFTLSYNEKYEQANWVAYLLSKENLRQPNVSRKDWFEQDKDVKTGSAGYYDYSGSGYSRGHLVPAADMAFSEIAMEQTFLMSNISPQIKEFNNGIWNELEQNVRNWAWDNNKIYIVSGPVLEKNMKFIKKGNVAVPKYFYKVILDIQEPERKGIAFLLPNQISERPLTDYVVTIDSIENITGIDFFKYLLTENEQERLESTVNISKWKFNDELYKNRIEVWNRQ